MALPNWYQRLVPLASYPDSQQLIDFAGAPSAGDDPSANRGLVGLVESSWANPLIYPEGGYPEELTAKGLKHLPTTRDESLLTAYSQARGLHTGVRVHGFVLTANANGDLVNGSRNQWTDISTLDFDRLCNSQSLEYFDSDGKKNAYLHAILPTEIDEAATGINEFTLDLVGAHTFNQFADLAVFIVPFDTLDLGVSSLDLPDYRLAPFRDKATRSLPMVVSSSHGGSSSMTQNIVDKDSTELWPNPPRLPPLYNQIDNTGLVLTMSAGDLVGGINFKDTGKKAEPLYFNTNFTSSPLFLTVGGSTLIQDGNKLTGVKAWRDPNTRKVDGSMEGGNGGFSPAVGAPAYQTSSPWMIWFQQQYLANSLLQAWSEPSKEADLFPWWQSDGVTLQFRTAGFSRVHYKFWANADAQQGLLLEPASMRSLPDLSHLAWKEDFPSILWKGTSSLLKDDWPQHFEWGGDGGTSLASPATAAMISAANVHRRRKGLADLSATEIHAILYQLRPGILSDVTELQKQAATGTSVYGAFPGFDFASGIGAIGGSRSTDLVSYLGDTVLPMLATDASGQPSSFLFKPSGLPLLVQKLRGTTVQISLVTMNGYGANAVLAEAAADPGRVRNRLVEVLAKAAADTNTQIQSVQYQIRTINPVWTEAEKSSILRRPLRDVQSTEGVAVAADSLVDLASLPDIFPNPDLDGGPAWYALVEEDQDGRTETLDITPFLAGRGSLLGQGGVLRSQAGEPDASLVVSALQRPLLVADVASDLGHDQPGAAVEVELCSVAGLSSLYGVYPVLDAHGRLSDGQGRTIAPGDTGYAALALKAAFGDGVNTLIWETPDHSSRRYTHTQTWSATGASDGSSLLGVLEPGKLYQHFILPSNGPQQRQEVIRQLLQGTPSEAMVSRAWFAETPANADGLSHVIGLREEGAFVTLGFEDLSGLGDRDFNDVVASWRTHDIPLGIGSLTLLDPAASRTAQLAAGSGSGDLSTVVMVDTASGLTLQHWLPFGAGDRCGVQIGSGDVNGDGFDDLVALRASVEDAGDGSLGSEVAVLLGGSDYNPAGGSDLPPTPSVLRFRAFGSTGPGLLSLGVRDLNNDGYAEILLCAAEPDSQRSRLPFEIWTMATGRFQTMDVLDQPGGPDLDPRRGYTLAVGDLQGDGVVEVLLGDLQGSDLSVNSVKAGEDSTSLHLVAGPVLQPYGSAHSRGIRPTIVSAQQTLIQKPSGLVGSGLSWDLSLPGTIPAGPTDPLLGGLGTAGALIVQSTDPHKPDPVEIPLTWLTEAPEDSPVSIPWSTEDGAPVFASGGVSYRLPRSSSESRDGVVGSPAPVLVTAGSRSTGVSLLTAPTSGTDKGQWQPSTTRSDNTLSFGVSTTPTAWINPWTYADSPSNPAAARERYGLVTTALVSYTPPFDVTLNPLGLINPSELTLDFEADLNAFIQDVVIPWNQVSSQGGNPGFESYGPGTPNSPLPPYPGNPTSPPYPTTLPTFSPDFDPKDFLAGVDCTGPASIEMVQLFQQRLINAYFTSMGLNYQHHHSPLWYSPQSWPSPLEPTPQVKYVSSPPGRQTQGMDCSHTSSWNYDLALGIWLNDSIKDQATTTTATGDWLGTTDVLTRQTVATALTIYGEDGGKTSTEIMSYLNKTLLPGDILYLSGSNIQSYISSNHTTPGFSSDFSKDILTDSGAAEATHVVTWINDNTSSTGLKFVSLPDGATGSGLPGQAFVIDSTGSESQNYQKQSYPNGVQIRQFDDGIWYFEHISHVERWLTLDNVSVMARGLCSGL